MAERNADDGERESWPSLSRRIDLPTGLSMRLSCRPLPPGQDEGGAADQSSSPCTSPSTSAA